MTENKRLLRTVVFLLAVSSTSIFMVESQQPFFPANNIDWMKTISQYLNATGGITSIDDAIAALEIEKLLDNPMILDAVNSSGIDPIIFKAFISSTSPHVLVRSVNVQRIIDVYTNSSNEQHIALVVIDSLDFNTLMDSVNFTKFFDQPNVGNSLNKSGINPVLLKAFIKHTNVHKMMKAIKLTQLVDVYVLRNNISKGEESKRVLNDIDTDLFIDSVDWDALLLDEDFVQYLNQSGVTPFTVGLLRTIGVRNLLKSMDSKALVRDIVSGSFDSKDMNKMLMKYISSEKLIANVKFGTVMQGLLQADDPLVVTDLCSKTFMEMLFPLPNLSNLDPNDPSAIRALKHPFLQRKFLFS